MAQKLITLAEITAKAAERKQQHDSAIAEMNAAAERLEHLVTFYRTDGSKHDEKLALCAKIQLLMKSTKEYPDWEYGSHIHNYYRLWAKWQKINARRL